MSAVSNAERQTRINLVACYRFVDRSGMSDTTCSHISARLTDRPKVIMLNPYGWMYHEVTESKLTAVDLEGEKQGQSPYPVITAGFVIRSAI